MEFLWRTDWRRLFTPEMSLPEILVRGTLIYLTLCLLLRLVLKRQTGKVSLSDLLVVAVVAGVCRNPLVRDAYSVTDGVLMVATILAWSYALDWLSYYVPLVHKLLHSPPIPLIRDGQVLKQNLQRELMTESQLGAKLRASGVRDPAEVAEAWMEGDGNVSIIKKQEPEPPRRREDAAAPRPERNGAPLESDVQAFLEAAHRLEDRLAAHQRGIAEIQGALGRFGFRIKPAAQAGRRKARPSSGENMGRPAP